MIYTLIMRDKKGVIEEILSFDVITEYNNTLSASITKNTVENGFPIADHMNIENEKFDISGMITNFSIFNGEMELVWNGKTFDTVGSQMENRHLYFEKRFKSLILERRVFTLLRTTSNSQLDNINKYDALLNTVVDEYKNCLCSSMSFNESSGRDEVVSVKMSIEQVKIAYTEKRIGTKEEMQPAIRGRVIQNTPVNKGTTSNPNSSDTSDTKDVASVNPMNNDATKSLEADINQKLYDMERNKASTTHANKIKSDNFEIKQNEAEAVAYQKASSIPYTGN